MGSSVPFRRVDSKVISRFYSLIKIYLSLFAEPLRQSGSCRNLQFFIIRVFRRPFSARAFWQSYPAYHRSSTFRFIFLLLNRYGKVVHIVIF